MRVVILLVVLISSLRAFSQHLSLIDSKATKKTFTLYQNLYDLSGNGLLFGHQDDLAYGIGWWASEGKSDPKLVAGDYPALFGWDLGKVGEERNLDSISFKQIRKWIREVYKMGGVNTVSWHMINLSNGTNAWDKDMVVKDIMPGGRLHEEFVDKLNHIGDFVNSCRSGFNRIPILFRPFHEHNGTWFWWGKDNCTEEEYISLWRFTVDYLRIEKKVRNLIYVYSPDASRLDSTNFDGSYLYGYPGDDYVDILGIDDYWNVGRKENNNSFEVQMSQYQANLTYLSDLGLNRNKPVALTETGLEGITDPEWFTKYLSDALQNKNIRISYAMVWRNHNKKHHYAPYPGHNSSENFKEFMSNDKIYFLSEIDKIYKSKK